MEQKQLDEIEESFFGEEFVDDDDFLDTKPTVEKKPEVKVEKTDVKVEEVAPKKEVKVAKKKVAKKITKKVVKKAEPKVEQKIEKKAIKKEVQEKVTEKKTEVKKEGVTITPAKEVSTKKKVIEKEEVKPVAKVKKEEPVIETTPRPVDPWADESCANCGDESSSFSGWKALTMIAIVLLVFSVYTNGFNFGDSVTGGAVLDLSEAEQKALDFVNTNLLQAPYTAELESSKDLGELYEFSLSVAGQEVKSYMTKDGSLFFPQGVEIVATEVFDGVISVDDDAFKGDANAPVTIVEFSEYECPFCAKYVNGAYSQIIENYVNTGKVKYVFRDFPLGFHEYAQKAAEAAECAGEEDKYWEMHDVLFANQHALDVDSLKMYALEIGLDEDDFNSCLDDGDMAEEVMKDAADGQKYGVSGTPGFFINGKLISGAQPYEVFVAEIEAALAVANGDVVEEVTEEVPAPVVELDDAIVDVEHVAEAKPEAIPTEESAPTPVIMGETREFTLTSKKWSFTPDKLTVNKGDLVKLRIVPDNSKTAFSLPTFTFSVPDYQVEQEIGGDTTIEFVASSAGTYVFKCGSCEDWRGMSGQLVVQE